MDYTPLEDTEELPTLTVEGFEETEVSEAKLTHITETLDHYAVYQVYPAKELTGKKVVDTRWVITRNPNGSLKARLTGRDYKWREPGREDVHAAMSQPHNARLVDFLALKDDDRPDDPLTSFEIDLVGAYYQVEQDEEIYAYPPKEWVDKRRSKGEETHVVWRLVKQLPGQRAAGNRFLHMVTDRLGKLGWIQCPEFPNYYRKPETRLVIDTHMDDWHGVGRASEAAGALPELRDAFKLKATDAFVRGKYAHLKRPRVKGPDGTLVMANKKHIDALVLALGLEGCNPSPTPTLSDERPAIDPALPDQKARLYRSCSMALQYVAQDRGDIQFATQHLTRHMREPTEYDMRCLVRVGRYLSDKRERGYFLHKIDQQKYPAGIVDLDTQTDTDWASDRASRKSIACINIEMDGCPIMAVVRQQGFLALSSAEAELGGMLTGATESYGHRRLLEWLGFRVRWRLGTDSSAAKGFAAREGVGRMRHIDLKILWLQKASHDLGLSIYKVPGEYNRANIGTKKLTAVQLERESRLTGLLDALELGDENVPAVHAVTSDVSRDVLELASALARVLGRV